MDQSKSSCLHADVIGKREAAASILLVNNNIDVNLQKVWQGPAAFQGQECSCTRPKARRKTRDAALFLSTSQIDEHTQPRGVQSKHSAAGLAPGMGAGTHLSSRTTSRKEGRTRGSCAQQR
jgi:hypothetical protein